MSNNPDWVDPEISAELPRIRQNGEGQHIEFKREFPEQAHEIAKDLAGFGTRGQGQLYLGIDDDGVMLGIDVEKPSDRDAVERRARGIARTIDPPLTIDVCFALEEERVVLVVTVPMQEEPVYYYNGRPIIRDGTESRPARPEEVKFLCQSHPSAEEQRRQRDLEFQKDQMHVDSLKRFQDIHHETRQLFVRRKDR